MKTSFWFAALSPFVSAVVAFATAAAMMRGSRINSSNRAGQAFGMFVDQTMKTSHAELIATPQFDSGRWKLRLERVPSSTDKQFTGRVVSSIAVGFTILSPLVCLIVAYLWARVVG